MKLNVKPFSKFVNESEDADQELRDLGFDQRRTLQDPEELEEVLHELFFDDPEINATWQRLTTQIKAQVEKLKAEYKWDSGELADIADYHYEASRDYTGDRLSGLISGTLWDLAEEGND
jgi:hypothetical protein